MNPSDQQPSLIGDLIKNQVKSPKPPAYPWQDLALRVTREIKIPPFKRNAVFKVCRDYPRQVIERCLADTKELCPTGEQWRYFFKLIESSKDPEKHNLA